MNEQYELNTKACKKIQDTTTKVLKSIEPKIPFLLHIGSTLMTVLKGLLIIWLAWAEGALLMYAYLMITNPGPNLCPCNLKPIHEVPLAISPIDPDSGDESATKPLSRSQAIRMRPDPK
jgi:hypothetical protein